MLRVVGVRLRLHNSAAGGGVPVGAAGAAQRAGPHRARDGPRAAVPALGARHLRGLLLPGAARGALVPRALAQLRQRALVVAAARARARRLAAAVRAAVLVAHAAPRVGAPEPHHPPHHQQLRLQQHPVGRDPALRRRRRGAQARAALVLVQAAAPGVPARPRTRAAARAPRPPARGRARAAAMIPARPRQAPSLPQLSDAEN